MLPKMVSRNVNVPPCRQGSKPQETLQSMTDRPLEKVVVTEETTFPNEVSSTLLRKALEEGRLVIGMIERASEYTIIHELLKIRRDSISSVKILSKSFQIDSVLYGRPRGRLHRGPWSLRLRLLQPDRRCGTGRESRRSGWAERS